MCMISRFRALIPATPDVSKKVHTYTSKMATYRPAFNPTRQCMITVFIVQAFISGINF